MGEKLPFWKVANTHFKDRGEFSHSMLFKHGPESYYSKTKGGVDGTTQYQIHTSVIYDTVQVGAKVHHIDY